MIYLILIITFRQEFKGTCLIATVPEERIGLRKQGGVKILSKAKEYEKKEE